MAGGCGERPRKTKGSKCPGSKQDKDNKSRCKSACPEEGTGKDAFGRKSCPKVGEEEEIECHESLKKFFEKDVKKCPKKYISECGKPKEKSKCEEKCGKPKEKTKCEEKCEKPKKKTKCEKKCEKPKEKTECEKKCERPKEKTKCEKKSKEAKKKDKCKKPCEEKISTESSQCGPSKEGQSACGKLVGSSKKGSFCKHFGKKYVKFEHKPKDCSSEDTDNSLKMPEPQVMTVKPCLPRLEKGISVKGRKIACITTDKPSCPVLKKSMMPEFFCIDARNMKLNACIKQYLKTDPSQIKSNCSQFARKRMHTVTNVPSPVLCGLQALQPPPPLSRAGFLPQKYRQIMGRWLPTAGLYVAATAAVAVWLTEWNAVVKHIPFYKDEEEGVPTSKPTEPPEVPPSTSEELAPASTSEET